MTISDNALNNVAIRRVACRNCEVPAHKACVGGTTHDERLEDARRWYDGYTFSNDARAADISALTALLASYTSQVASLNATLAAAQAAAHMLTDELSAEQGENDALKAQIAVLTAPPVAEDRTLIDFRTGLAYGGNDDVVPLEKRLGHTLGARRTYWDNTKTAAMLSTAAADLKAGRMPALSIKVGDWKKANAGAVDGWAQSCAQKLSALGGPVLVAVHHEPEGDADIADWIALQKRLAPIFDLPNVYFGICVTGWNEFFGSDKYDFDAIWPVGAPIKFFAVDVYQKNTTTDLNTAYWAKCDAVARKYGVPFAVWETGISDESFAKMPKWFTNEIAALRLRSCFQWLYFDSGLNSAQSWRASEGSPKEAALFRVL